MYLFVDNGKKNLPTLAIWEPDMIKEVLMNTGDGSFQKARNNPLAKLLFGQGLDGLDGEEWALHRRIANQAFMNERDKVMSLFALSKHDSFFYWSSPA